MDDRSIHSHDVSQSVIVTGSANNVRLTFGDSGVVLPLRRAQFCRPERQRRAIPGQRLRELDILAFDAGKLPIVGRAELLADLRAWLDDGPDISVHALTGRAGIGKTRLALEICHQIDCDPAGKGLWLAGFLSPSDLTAVVETLATRSFTWERHTLLVLDYAAQCHKPLARWLDRLVHQTLDTKLRILLLEREAPESFGWWHELSNPAFQTERARLDLFHAARPTVLPDLAALDERRKLMTAALQAAQALRPEAPTSADVPGPGADPAFDARLAHPQFGDPLSLVMAGVIALDRGPQGALALRRLDAARQLGKRELARLAAMAGVDPHDQAAMRHMVAFNGLIGGLRINCLRQTVATELASSQRQADLDALLSVLQQELPSRAGAEETAQGLRLATIQPDLIGEAAIIEAFTGSATLQAEAVTVVRRAYMLGQDDAAQALVRLVQDYAYLQEEQSATDAEKATARRIMDWLLTLARAITDMEQLVPLVSALPSHTTILRELAAELTARLADFFRQKAKRGGELLVIYEASIWINNLAIRLSDLGQHEAALAAVEEAVQLRRALAKAHPDAFTPGLASSLDNLANRLGSLGQREKALKAAEEAIQLRRALVKMHPDTLTPVLAGSLANLANCLTSLGRREDAFKAADESVQLYRALAEARPDAFTPNLADSLSNLANRLGDLGRHEDAFRTAEAAVQLHRALAEARPDAFIPNLAKSLSNLANRLGSLGQRENAFKAAEEAVQLYRTLAKTRPNAFTPDLARSLSNLAALLSKLGRRKEAREAAEAAVQLYRTLAKARPDAFTPNLAGSLTNFSVLLGELGRREEVREAAEEAVQLYRTLAKAHPAAFTPDLAGSLGNLANCLGKLGRREAAVQTAEEAVQLYRTLAGARPDAFTPDLARSLWVLGDFYTEVERPDLALSTLQEGVERITPVFAAIPAAFKVMMDGLFQSYLSQCEALGRQPDIALLALVRDVFKRLHPEGNGD